MNTGSFTVHVKTDDIYKGIEEDVGKRFEIFLKVIFCFLF